MSPRQVWQSIKKVLPTEAIISTDIGNNGAIGNSMNELTACGRNDWPPITMVVFRNYQWGAEKRNTTLWYDDNFVGTELNVGVEYAELAKACGLVGMKVASMEELEKALKS